MTNNADSSPRWHPPFIPDKSVWSSWLWKLSTPAIIREIASADWGYDPTADDAVRDLLRDFNPAKRPPFKVHECLELCSINEYEDEAGTDTCMLLAGSVCIALEASGVGYCATGMPGRIARCTHAALKRDRDTRLAYTHLMAWAATRCPEHSECPQSYFAASVLCLAVIDRAWNPKRSKGFTTPFETDEHIESLALDLKQIFDAEADDLDEFGGTPRPKSLDALDDAHQGARHWPLNIDTAIAECGPGLPETRRVLQRLR